MSVGARPGREARARLHVVTYRSVRERGKNILQNSGTRSKREANLRSDDARSHASYPRGCMVWFIRDAASLCAVS